MVEVATLQLAGQARERLLPQQPEQHDACRQWRQRHTSQGPLLLLLLQARPTRQPVN